METESTPITSASNPSATPGVYGDVDILQIDVSRLPRLDEYYGTLDSRTGLVRSPHDVRTVTYFLGSGTSSNGERVSGLVRREINRAAGLYAGSNGEDASAADDQLLAPEVVALELQYFDGTEWLTSWDTGTKKGLPLAIEIAIEVQAEQPATPASSLTSWLSSTGQGPSTEVYRLIVDLPAAKAVEESTSATTTQEQSSSTSSSQSTGGGMP
jgi:hypothetical protein